LATAVVQLVPELRLGYRNVGAHVALEATATVICGLVSLLLYGRYRRTQRLRELLLVYALGLLCLTALVFVARPGGIGNATASQGAVWVALVTRLVAGLLLVSAAVMSPARIYRATHPARDVLGLAGLFAAIGMLVLVIGWRFPGLLDVSAWIQDSTLPTLVDQPLFLSVQLIGLLCYALAALVFTREASRGGDELLGWFGAAAALATWARINFFLSPTLYTEWLSLGDLLRLGFLVLLFVGALREIRDHWLTEATAAALNERRRLARDLHDGVVQELGYIRSRALCQRGPQEEFALEIVACADRALGEARQSIDALTEERDEDLAATLGRAATEIGRRYGVVVHLSLAIDVTFTPAQRAALVRIMREAVSNAARHGAPHAVWVNLANGEMTVRDDGHGFEATASARPGSFGLTSMRERATSVGASVEITSSLEGTKVMATW
jgi:signal transduction histidine kinase